MSFSDVSLHIETRVLLYLSIKYANEALSKANLFHYKLHELEGRNSPCTLSVNDPQLISDFVFATWRVQSLNFLNSKFQASSHLLWLYSPICVRPGRKPRIKLI